MGAGKKFLSRRNYASALVAIAALALTACAGGEAELTDEGQAAATGTKQETGDGGDSGGSAPNGEPITIAVTQPFTGSVALSASEIRNGVQLAVDHINADGGIDGRPLTIVEYDTKLETQEAVNVLTRAVQQDGAVAAVGPYATSEVIAVQSASNRLETSIISPTVSGTAATQGDEAAFVFRSGTVLGHVVAANVAQAAALGCQAPSVIHDEGGYGEEYGEVLAESTDLVASETMPVSATDVTSQVQSLAAAGTDCVYVVASSGGTAGLVLSQMAAVGLEATAIGPDSLVTADTARAAGESINELEGVYAVQALDVERSDYQEMLDTYVDAYGEEPVAPFWVGAYDATRLIGLGLEASGGEGGVALRDALEGLGGDAYEQLYGGPDAESGYGPDDHDWLDENYLVSYEVTTDGTQRVELE